MTLTTFAGALMLSACAAGAQVPQEMQTELFAIERESHQQWWRGDTAALDALMSESFRFVAMSGGVETKDEVLGRDRDPGQAGERALQVTSLVVEPEELVLQDNIAVVISLLRMEATLRGRPLPASMERMRILSIFVREGPDQRWRLAARSITPIITPPNPGGH